MAWQGVKKYSEALKNIREMVASAVLEAVERPIDVTLENVVLPVLFGLQLDSMIVSNIICSII